MVRLMGISTQYFDEFKTHFEIRPGHVFVKPAKDEPAFCVPSAEVAAYPYIILNPGMLCWVHVDIDLPKMPRPVDGETQALALQRTAFDPAPYGALNIPLPAFAVLSGKSFHLLWPLLRPLPPHPSPVSRRYYHDVRRNLMRALGGDIACGVHMIGAKNPFFVRHTAVKYPSGPCTLEALRLEAAPQDVPHWRQLDYDTGQRNCASFRAALAYFHRVGGASEDELAAFLADYQAGANTPPLPVEENWDIAKSIVRNGDIYKSRADRNYGVMGLPTLKGTDLPAEERRAAIRQRQGEGARYSAACRAAECRLAIAGAVEALKQAGQKITGEAVARAADVDVRTVRRHLIIRDGQVTWKAVERQEGALLAEESAQ
jgi:hypothetical protein